MKIKQISFDNFRVYNTDENLPYIFEIENNKKIILLFGNNGLGKTSFFDGIEWNITGQIQRYEKNNGDKNDYSILKNYFNSRKEGSVEILFDNEKIFKRSFDVSDNSKKNGEGLPNISIINDNFNVDLSKQFNVSHFLSQDLIDSFIRETKEQERYQSFLSLYGLTKENNYKGSLDSTIKKIKDELKLIKEKITEKNNEISEKKKELSLKSNAEKYTIIENELKSHLKVDILDLDEILISNNNYKNDNFLELDKKRNIKKILDWEEKFKNDIIELEKLNKFKEKIEKILKQMQIKETIIEILKSKDNYITYLSLIEKEKINNEKIVTLQNDLDRIEKSIKSQDKAIIYLKEKSYFLEELDNLNRLELLVTGNHSLIQEKDNYIKSISKLRENFLISSRDFLIKEEDTSDCPLCGKGNFSKNDIILKLETEINSDVSKTITKYHGEILEIKKSNEEKTKEKKNILDCINKFFTERKHIVEKEIKEINDFFVQLEISEIGYSKVVTLLNSLNISFENLEDIKKQNEQFFAKEEFQEKNYYTNTLTEIIANIKDISTKEFEIFLNLEKQKIDKEKLNSEIDSLFLLDIHYDKIIENIKLLNLFYKESNTKLEIKKLESSLNNIKIKQEKMKLASKDFTVLSAYIKNYIFDEVDKKTEDYEKTILSFYKILNPHKNFDDISLRLKSKLKQNDTLRFEVSNSEISEKINPAYIFSSAQNNVLAIAIFLSFALDTKWSKLDSIFLDDPIQNMDDINIHAFTDLIRRVSEEKQVFLSTHDERVKDFMLMKFGEENVQLIEFEGYGKIRKKDTDFRTNPLTL